MLNLSHLTKLKTKAFLEVFKNSQREGAKKKKK